MEKHNKIKKHIGEAKRILDLFYLRYKKDLTNEIYEKIITTLNEIIDELYGAQLKAIELDKIMEEKMTKEEKIKYLVDLFKQSDEDYVDCVFKFLCEEDSTYVPNILGSDDWEAFKFMILNGDIE